MDELRLAPVEADALRRGNRRIPRPERDLVPAIIQALRQVGVFCYRSPAGAARYPKRGGGERHVRYGPRGMADITGIVPVPCPQLVASSLSAYVWTSWMGEPGSPPRQVSPSSAFVVCQVCLGTGRAGLALAIEVKTSVRRAKPTKLQEAFLASVRAAGGIGITARSVEEALQPVLARMGRG